MSGYEDVLFAVEPNHAIVLAEGSICVDAHSRGCKYRIVTHIHADHTYGLRESIRRCDKIIMSIESYIMLREMGYRVPERKLALARPGDCLTLGRAEACFESANHIPGTLQVRVEYEGFSVGYTSDFKQPTEPMRGLDVLIFDATYGDYERPWQKRMASMLVDVVRGLVERDGGVVLYGYRGKCQEVLKILRLHGVDEPFIIMDRVLYRATRALAEYWERQGFNAGTILYGESPEAQSVMRRGGFVAYERMRMSGPGRLYRRWVKVELSGWLLHEPLVRVNDRYWILSFSDHADYAETLEYVLAARPRLAVADASRSELARDFVDRFIEEGYHEEVPIMYLPREASEEVTMLDVEESGLTFVEFMDRYFIDQLEEVVRSERRGRR